MSQRFLVTRPCFMADQILLPGHTFDADDDFVPAAHHTPVPVALPPDTVLYPVTVPATPTVPVIPTLPASGVAPTVNIHKVKPRK